MALSGPVNNGREPTRLTLSGRIRGDSDNTGAEGTYRNPGCGRSALSAWQVIGTHCVVVTSFVTECASIPSLPTMVIGPFRPGRRTERHSKSEIDPLTRGHARRDELSPTMPLGT